jgi:hypothetical protein
MLGLIGCSALLNEQVYCRAVEGDLIGPDFMFLMACRIVYFIWLVR